MCAGNGEGAGTGQMAFRNIRMEEETERARRVSCCSYSLSQKW